MYLDNNGPKFHHVSTHSRPKAAGVIRAELVTAFIVSTHSRPKAAGCFLTHSTYLSAVSTHSRPKAAGS